MRPRSDLVELFSTFLMFEGTRASWTPDAPLRRSMGQAVKTQADSSPPDEKLWAIYWHRHWLKWQAKATTTATPPAPQARRATNHLIAYLQEPGYWGANKVVQGLRSSNHQLNDLFQSAMARVLKVLNGFDPVVSTSLRSYAEYCFTNIIKDQLRKRREIDACTPWGLLNRVSHKRLAEALERGGIQGNLQQQYFLAWRCYREHYGPTVSKATDERVSFKKLTKPSAEIWQAIANTYNRERTSQLTAAAPATTATAIETQLITTVKLVRNLQNPRAISLDTPLKGSEEDSGDFYDLLPDNEQVSAISELIDQEIQEQRQSQHQQLSDVLSQAIAQFSPPDQALLQAYYGEQLTQSEIAKRLTLKQYSISRKLSRLRQKLLKTLLDSQAQFIAQNSTAAEANPAQLHNDLSPAVLDAMGNSLEEWLASHYRLHSLDSDSPSAEPSSSQTSLRSQAATMS